MGHLHFWVSLICFLIVSYTFLSWHFSKLQLINVLLILSLMSLFWLCTAWGQGPCLLHHFNIHLLNEQRNAADSPWPFSSHLCWECLHLGWLSPTSTTSLSVSDASSRKPPHWHGMEVSPLIPVVGKQDERAKRKGWLGGKALTHFQVWLLIFYRK